MKKVSNFLVLLALGVLLLRGFVLLKLWLWFIIPFGADPISFAHSVGLCVIGLFFTFRYNGGEDTENQEINKWMRVILPLFCLLYGYIFKYFM
uniref:Holin n=1 Tax=viral metagenome TaxID=1070528 RepID=A0A6M3XT23_9ZZZZ